MRSRRATGRPAAWKATPSRWRITATGPMPPSRPTCGRWRSRGPTRCAAGKSFEQSVSLTFTGKLPKPKGRGGAKPIAVALGGGAGACRASASAFRRKKLTTRSRPPHALKAAGLQQLDLPDRWPPRRMPPRSAGAIKQLGDATGADVVLEIILTGTESPDAELAPVGGQAMKWHGLSPWRSRSRLRRTCKATLPGSAGPEVAPLADIYKAARAAFPGVRLGGGMFSYFTELNRKRPPVELLDYRDAHDLPDRACRRRHLGDGDAGGAALCDPVAHVPSSASKTPYWVGPSSIAARDNPYGASTAANPDNQPHLPSGHGPAPARPVRRRLDSRLRRRLRPRRCRARSRSAQRPDRAA